MQSENPRASRFAPGRHVLAFVLAYVVTKVIAAALGFRYNMFSDPFDAVKLVIDLGLWALVYLTVVWILNRRANRSPKP